MGIKVRKFGKVSKVSMLGRASPMKNQFESRPVDDQYEKIAKARAKKLSSNSLAFNKKKRNGKIKDSGLFKKHGVQVKKKNSKSKSKFKSQYQTKSTKTKSGYDSDESSAPELDDDDVDEFLIEDDQDDKDGQDEQDTCTKNKNTNIDENDLFAQILKDRDIFVKKHLSQSQNDGSKAAQCT